jgi:hypothetical protein
VISLASCSSLQTLCTVREAKSWDILQSTNDKNQRVKIELISMTTGVSLNYLCCKSKSHTSISINAELGAEVNGSV